VARAYSSSGVAGISVLVEPDFFSGSEALFTEMRSLVRLPMLFKDFVIAEAQIETANQLGADALLLVAKALTAKSLSTFVDRCLCLGIEPLVEIHDEEDLVKLRDSGCTESVRLVGINSRDLRSLRTDLRGMSRLREMVGSGKTLVAESGLTKPSDLKAVQGFDAVLIGSAFMNAEDVAEKVREIVAACRRLT
jgi:indole-3-glycerol phosphate synthase